MTNKEAISVIENEIQIDVRLCTDKQVDKFQTALYMAISALRAEPTGKALTLEQLREMDGKPVWIKNFEEPEKSQWRLCHWDRGKYLVLQGISVRGYLVEDYSKQWLAYAYPPAHIDREAWTAEWRELHGDKMVGLDDCGDDVYRHYHYSVCTSCGKGSAVKSNFCPVCGKAMTPGALAELEKRMGV